MKNTQLRLGATLWLLAMSGVIALATTVVPQLFEKVSQPVSLTVAIALTVVQGAVMLLLAVWTGVALSSRLGLGAPAIEAAISGSGGGAVLKRQLLPAGVVGILSGGVLLIAHNMTPAELLAAQQGIKFPLIARVLYGGVVEEVLMRWGVMTVLIWLPWRFIQKKVSPPRVGYVIGAIVAAAGLFAAGHLPAAATVLGGSLTGQVVAYILVGNSVPGIMYGYLYWRYGLESAMLAHALTHVLIVFAIAS